MQLVFEQLFGGSGEPDTLVDLIDFHPDNDAKRYLDIVVGGVADHAAELDAEIASCLRGWTLDRISKVDHAILRLGAFEVIHTGIPGPVAITEAVELTRKFSSEDSCAFVNGVLGSIYRKQEKQE